MSKVRDGDITNELPSDIEGIVKAYKMARDKQSSLQAELNEWKSIADAALQQVGEILLAANPGAIDEDKASLVGTFGGNYGCRFTRWKVNRLREKEIERDYPEIFQKYNHPYYRQTLTSYLD